MPELFGLLRDILSSDGGAFAFIAGVLLFIIWLTYWVTKKVTTINNSHDNLEKESQKLYGKIEADYGKLEGNIDEIRRDLSFLKGMIDIFKSGTSPLAQSHSPISLTELGNQVAKELDAEGMVQRNWDAIMKDVEEHAEGKTAYDIQEYCMETAVVEPERFLIPDDMAKLKDYAFKQGKPIAVYSQIFAILIRDKYLQIKDIPVEEVDRTKPVN